MIITVTKIGAGQCSLLQNMSVTANAIVMISNFVSNPFIGLYMLVYNYWSIINFHKIVSVY